MEFDFYDASSPLTFSIELIFTVSAIVDISAPRLNSAKLPTAKNRGTGQKVRKMEFNIHRLNQFWKAGCMSKVRKDVLIISCFLFFN